MVVLIEVCSVLHHWEALVSYFQSHGDIEKPDIRVQRVANWLSNLETLLWLPIPRFHPGSIERVQQTFLGIHYSVN